VNERRHCRWCGEDEIARRTLAFEGITILVVEYYCGAKELINMSCDYIRPCSY